MSGEETYNTGAVYDFVWLPPEHRHCRGCGAVIGKDRVLCEVCDGIESPGGMTD